MKGLLRKSLSTFFVIIFAACSISAPEINETDWELIIQKDIEKDIVFESLSVFLNCYDEDGENDIETLFFIDDKNGIYWELNSETWDVKKINQTKWIGASNLIMPNRKEIPRTTIRIHVRDLAGETVEDNIYITKQRINTQDLKFPELKIENDNLSLVGYNNGSIDLYSDSLKVASGLIEVKSKTFTEIFKKEKESFDSELKIYITVINKDLTLKSGPWYF